MFDLKKILNGRTSVPEPEIYLAGSDISVGMALTLSGGKLTKCSGTTVPTHVAMGSAVTGGKVAAAPVNSDQRYETEITVDYSGDNHPKEGDKVTISADGLGVTATTASGVATIVALNGAKAVGDKITVKF